MIKRVRRKSCHRLGCVGGVDKCVSEFWLQAGKRGMPAGHQRMPHPMARPEGLPARAEPQAGMQFSFTLAAMPFRHIFPGAKQVAEDLNSLVLETFCRRATQACWQLLKRSCTSRNSASWTASFRPPWTLSTLRYLIRSSIEAAQRWFGLIYNYGCELLVVHASK